MVQSIHASAPCNRGLPSCDSLHSTPRNLSVPLRAKACDSCDWCSPRMLTQNRPVRRMRGHVVEPLPAHRPMSGGLRETEKNDWHAKPTGSSPDIDVTIV